MGDIGLMCVYKDGSIMFNGIRYIKERTCCNVSERDDVFTCSVCKANVLVEDHIGYIMWTGEKYTNKLEFCPNCGAKVCTE